MPESAMLRASPSGSAKTACRQAAARGRAAIRHGGGAALLCVWQKGQGWWEMANVCQVVLHEVNVGDVLCCEDSYSGVDQYVRQ